MKPEDRALISLALGHYGGATENYEASVRAHEAYVKLLRRDWAVRVLDAWSEYTGHAWETDTRAECVNLYSLAFNGPAPDAARLVAAEAVWPGLPESVRAEIGSKP